MKNIIKILSFVILAVNMAIFAGNAPGVSSRGLYSREDSSGHSSDSLDGLVDTTDTGEAYLGDDYDSLDGLFDEVSGAARVDREEYDPDSLDDAVSEHDVERYNQKDLPRFQKKYRKMLTEREELASKKSNLERECEEYDCEKCCEIDDLSQQIKDLSVSIRQARITIKHLQNLYAG